MGMSISGLFPEVKKECPYTHEIKLGPCDAYLSVTTHDKVLPIFGKIPWTGSNGIYRCDNTISCMETCIRSESPRSPRIVSAEHVCFCGEKILLSDKWSGAVFMIELPDGLKDVVCNVRPRGVTASDDGNLLALVNNGVHEEGGSVMTISPVNYDVLSEWGQMEKHTNGLKWRPRGICFDNKGRLIVADVVKGGASMFAMDGTKLVEFLDQVICGPTCHPGYVMVDIFDRVYISYREASVILVFDERGNRIGCIKDPGEVAWEKSAWVFSEKKVNGMNDGLLPWCPRGMCSDIRGSIIVCDSANRCIWVFDLEGMPLGHLYEKPALGYPTGIAHNKYHHNLVVTYHDSQSFDSRLRAVVMYEWPKSSTNIAVDIQLKSGLVTQEMSIDKKEFMEVDSPTAPGPPGKGYALDNLTLQVLDEPRHGGHLKLDPSEVRVHTPPLKAHKSRDKERDELSRRVDL